MKLKLQEDIKDERSSALEQLIDVEGQPAIGLFRWYGFCAGEERGLFQEIGMNVTLPTASVKFRCNPNEQP